MAALKKANDIRTRRAQLKRDVKAGALSRNEMADLLSDPPEWLDTMKVFDFLLAVPRFGRVKVNRALTARHISPSKTIGGMSERQREEVVHACLRGF